MTNVRNFLSAVRTIPEIKSELVSIWFSECADGVELESVWSEVERGKGHASSAMRAVVALADEHCVDIKGQPHWMTYDTDAMELRGESEAEMDRLDALNKQKLSNEQLLAWYLRLGFELSGRYRDDDPEIVRRALAPALKP